MERLTQKLRIQKRTPINYLENLFNGVLNIFHGSGPRDLDPYQGSGTLDLKDSVKMLGLCPIRRYSSFFLK